jgi:hypothetical protein
MIDPSIRPGGRSGRRLQLEKAGWYLHDHSRLKIGIPVGGYDVEPWNGVTDYCLYASRMKEYCATFFGIHNTHFEKNLQTTFSRAHVLEIMAF